MIKPSLEQVSILLVLASSALAQTPKTTSTTRTSNAATASASIGTTTVTAKLDEAAKTVRVEIGGSLFTELVYAGQPKPVLFPVIGPGGMMMVRQWPMKEAAPGEEKDHPHHKGLWFCHGSVDGVDFWTEKPGCGTIIVRGVPALSAENGTVILQTKESWQKPDGVVVINSATKIQCGLDKEDHFIDYSVTLSAAAGDVVLGDTKEGSMAIRLNPLFNLKGEVAKGSAITSEGKTGDAAWGTNAKWVDYTAPVELGVMGVACFDHPSNLRFPTTWHARDYGLIAANPFGLHDFQKQPKGAGDYTLKKGAPLTMRYRWLFHRGDTATADIAGRWQTWSATK
jgi:Methane oxygenase PmoA